MITGVALKKINRVIQFVISERKLLPEAEVDDARRSPDTWKGVDVDFLNSTESVDGVDYHTLTWENRSINLDTIVLPSTHVLTGIRFKISGGRLALEIRATGINYKTGNLIDLEKSSWISNVGPKERTKIIIDRPDVPTRSAKIQIPIESDGTYLDFESSDIQKDIAQVTIPYIETVLLEASEPRPLAGAGLYYKGDPGFGGFVAVKLIAYDLKPTIKQEGVQPKTENDVDFNVKNKEL